MPTIGSREQELTAKGLVTVDGKTFPLRAARLQGRAEGGLATARLSQEYENPYDEPLEVIYTLPLPADGAVIAYTVHLGERVVTGRIERRETAREQYRRALEEGRTAGLLEQERSDTFTQTLGSLPPQVAVRVEIDVLHPLAVVAGAVDEGLLWEFRFPTVAGVRYQGEPGRVPESEKLDVTRADTGGTPVRLEVDVVVGDGPPAVVAPLSPSHELKVRADGNTSRVALADSARLDRDLVIRWQATRTTVGLSLVEGSGVAGDDDRYAVLTLTPPRVPEAVFPRDLTMLVDASGSMNGEPLEQAKRVAEELLRGLASGDRFEMLAFANETLALTDGPAPADDLAVDAAIRRLRELQAGGGTEMTRALRRALEPLRPDSQRQVILFTDGYIGFEHEIVAELIDKLPERARLHVVGIGSAPNRALTRGASRAGRGVEVIVGSGDSGREAANRLQRHTAAPVLTEIRVGGSAVLGAAPDRPGDVLAGSPASFAILLRSGGGTIEVEGRLAGRAEPWRERIEVGARSAADGTANATAGESPVRIPVGALYGRERVEDCEMRLAADGGESRLILHEIENLGIRHRIVTRRTSLVAISEDVAVDPRRPRRRERLAVELPAGVSAEGVGLAGLPFVEINALIGGSRKSYSLNITDARFVPRAFEAASRSIHQPQRVIIDGTIVRREHDLLMVEFEIPAQGPGIPKRLRRIQIEFEDGTTCDARVIPELSTRPGDHEPGLTVRLAIRLDDASARATAAPRLLRWTSRRHGEVVIRLRAD